MEADVETRGRCQCGQRAADTDETAETEATERGRRPCQCGCCDDRPRSRDEVSEVH